MYYEEVYGNLCRCGFFYMVLHADDENWKELIVTNKVEWNFDPDGNISMVQVGEWCDENLKEGWIIGQQHCGFYDANDAVAFKMRWL